jgi:heat shock protein HslJ
MTVATSFQVINVEEGFIGFSNLGGTRKMCINMEIPDSFNQAINQVSKYKIENMKLSFFDETGNELLRFKKVD